MLSFDKLKEFVAVWWESNSIKEVAFHFALDRYEVNNLATGLRRLGLNLKKMPYKKPSRHRNQLTSAQIVELIELSVQCLVKFEKEQHDQLTKANLTEAERELTHRQQMERINAQVDHTLELPAVDEIKTILRDFDELDQRQERYRKNGHP